MNINEAFPSNFLKAADLNGAQPTVTISHIKTEEIGEDRKMVLYFVGKEKGVVLNKTNATNIAAAYGPETDDWTGQKVTLFSSWVDFQGKSVEAIRIRKADAPRQQASVQQQPQVPTQQAQEPRQQQAPRFDPVGADFADDIPF